MSKEYGEFVSIPLTIEEHGKQKTINIYNPVKETPQFISLLEIVKKWVLVDNFDMKDIVLFTSKIMCIVNQAVICPHAGEYKKKLVLSLLFCCVKVSEMLLPEKNIAYSIISSFAPSAIDTMVSIARGDINVKQSIGYIEKNCFSIFESSETKKSNEISNTIFEHKTVTES